MLLASQACRLLPFVSLDATSVLPVSAPVSVLAVGRQCRLAWTGLNDVLLHPSYLVQLPNDVLLHPSYLVQLSNDVLLHPIYLVQLPNDVLLPELHPGQFSEVYCVDGHQLAEATSVTVARRII